MQDGAAGGKASTNEKSARENAEHAGEHGPILDACHSCKFRPRHSGDAEGGTRPSAPPRSGTRGVARVLARVPGTTPAVCTLDPGNRTAPRAASPATGAQAEATKTRRVLGRNGHMRAGAGEGDMLRKERQRRSRKLLSTMKWLASERQCAVSGRTDWANHHLRPRNVSRPFATGCVFAFPAREAAGGRGKKRQEGKAGKAGQQALRPLPNACLPEVRAQSEAELPRKYF